MPGRHPGTVRSLGTTGWNHWPHLMIVLNHLPKGKTFFPHDADCHRRHWKNTKIQLVNCIGKKPQTKPLLGSAQCYDKCKWLQTAVREVQIWYQEKLSTGRIVYSWNRLPRESVEFLSLENFQDLAKQNHSWPDLVWQWSCFKWKADLYDLYFYDSMKSKANYLFL